MPYIKQEDREKIVDHVREVYTESFPPARMELDRVLDYLISHIQKQDNKKGLCNYIVSRLVVGGMEPDEGWGYDTISNAHAALHDAACELQRRLMNGYEDSCIKRNGDVKEYAEARFKGKII